jgi:hypothetical protein
MQTRPWNVIRSETSTVAFTLGSTTTPTLASGSSSGTSNIFL